MNVTMLDNGVVYFDEASKWCKIKSTAKHFRDGGVLAMLKEAAIRCKQ